MALWAVARVSGAPPARGVGRRSAERCALAAALAWTPADGSQPPGSPRLPCASPTLFRAGINALLGRDELDATGQTSPTQGGGAGRLLSPKQLASLTWSLSRTGAAEVPTLASADPILPSGTLDALEAAACARLVNTRPFEATGLLRAFVALAAGSASVGGARHGPARGGAPSLLLAALAGDAAPSRGGVRSWWDVDAEERAARLGLDLERLRESGAEALAELIDACPHDDGRDQWGAGGRGGGRGRGRRGRGGRGAQIRGAPARPYRVTAVTEAGSDLADHDFAFTPEGERAPHQSTAPAGGDRDAPYGPPLPPRDVVEGLTALALAGAWDHPLITPLSRAAARIPAGYVFSDAELADLAMATSLARCDNPDGALPFPGRLGRLGRYLGAKRAQAPGESAGAAALARWAVLDDSTAAAWRNDPGWAGAAAELTAAAACAAAGEGKWITRVWPELGKIPTTAACLCLNESDGHRVAVVIGGGGAGVERLDTRSRGTSADTRLLIGEGLVDVVVLAGAFTGADAVAAVVEEAMRQGGGKAVAGG